MVKPLHTTARIIMVVMFPMLAYVGCATLAGSKSDREDASITAAVASALATDENLSPDATIRVVTTHGQVYLSGVVGSELERLRAAELVREVEGVVKVTNDLRVAGTISAPARAEH